MRNQIISTLTAVVLGVFIGMPAMATTFTDDSNIGTWSKDSIDILTDLGVVTGYPDGTFQPQQTLTREEYAVSLLQGLDVLNALVTEAYEADDTILYQELVNQQVMLLDALTAIDELQAQNAVEKNNYFAIGLGYGVSNSSTDDVSNIQLSGKFQVKQLSNTFAISIRPFVTTDATAGATVTIDANVAKNLTVYAGGGAASTWGNDSQLVGVSDDVVGLINAGVEYDLSKTTVVGIDAKTATNGDASWDPTVTGFVGLKF